MTPLSEPRNELNPGEGDFFTMRDGATVQIRFARPEDVNLLHDFFQHLSLESRHKRFLSAALPDPKFLDKLCQNEDPSVSLSLLALRTSNGKPKVVATASYHRLGADSAEVAFAVTDELQGRGLGTLLLERLAGLAVRQNFTRFYAITQADNQLMREVFRESGFAVDEHLDAGEISVNLRLRPSEDGLLRCDLRHRIATVASLSAFFRPKAIALVGASRQPQSIGGRLLEAIRASAYPGKIFPVNPQAAEIQGLPAFPSLSSLPAPVELAIIAVPPQAALDAIADCSSAGVRAVLVITAGFAEIGPEGSQRQHELVDRVRGAGMRMIGPNCLGLLSTDPAAPLNATFVPSSPAPGGIAMSSDSGGLGLALLSTARQMGLGIGAFVSVGNRADVSSNDLLEYWEEDPNVRVILLYLESFGNPRRFARIARRVSRRKPIVTVKAGRSQAGSRAAGSHTAALAASDVAVDALFHQNGVLRAESLADLFDLAAALDTQPLPPGKRVGIITNAGGPAILCTDACEASGLSVPELSDSLRSQLKAFLPATASLRNPVDMIASATPEDYQRVVAALLSSDEIDAAIVIQISTGIWSGETVIDAIRAGIEKSNAANLTQKPLMAALMSEPTRALSSKSTTGIVPCYMFPETPARVLGAMARYAEWRSQPVGRVPEFVDSDPAAARSLCAQAIRHYGSGWLGAEEVRQLLQIARLPVAPGGVAHTSDEAATLASSIGFPVAVKLVSRRLVHKTEFGGVLLNIRDAEEAQAAFHDIREKLIKSGHVDAFDGVLVQPMIRSGTEVFVGVTQDPLFGPLIGFGLGGIHVEILGDVCFRVAPLTDRDAHEMVHGIRGRKLFSGYRGWPPADTAALEQLLLRISALVEDVPEIVELDLNPVMALQPGSGCLIVDARVKVAPLA
jgi:acetyl coenzyme A synthetase (ADP forming)-like protein